MHLSPHRPSWVGPAALALLLATPATPAPSRLGIASTQVPTPSCPEPFLGTWSTKSIATTGFDEATAVAVDGVACAVYVAGRTSGALVPKQASAGLSDGFLARYGTAGTRTWLVQFGTAESEEVTGVAVAPDGSVYVVGSTKGTFASSPTINFGGDDVFIVKYDPGGVEQWTRQVGGVADEIVTRVAVDANGDVFIVGWTTGLLIGASAGDEDFFLARYDADGNLDLLIQDGTAGEDRALDVAIGPSGNVYIVGNTDGRLGATAYGGTDIFVAKYDAAGVRIWAEQRGTADLDLAGGIAVNSEGQVFVGGAVNGSLDGHVHHGGMDAVIMRYDANGTWRWTDQRGSSSTESVDAVALDADGGPYCVGWTSGAFDGNTSAGGADVFLMKHGRGGTWRWTSQFGGTASDVGRDVAMGSAGDLYVVGESSGTIGGLVNLGWDDGFALKFDTSGLLR